MREATGNLPSPRPPLGMGGASVVDTHRARGCREPESRAGAPLLPVESANPASEQLLPPRGTFLYFGSGRTFS